LKPEEPAMGFRTVRLAFSNPHVQVIEESPSSFVVDLPDFPGDSQQWPATGTRVCVRADQRVTAVEVSRSLFTSNEVYLVLDASDAALVVTDHFLTAVRHCKPDRRTPDDDALIDHFIFRTVPGEKTYARGVARLGRGRTACWGPTSSGLDIVRRQTVERPVTLAFSEALQVLEHSLEETIHSRGRAATDRIVTNLLSGGVDSTLLQVFLPPNSPSLSVAIDTPEFAPETDRALSASKMTRSAHHLVSLHERDYLEALERFITTTALPPHHMQSVLLGELFRLGQHETRDLLTAQFADALFGLNFLARPSGVLRRWGWIPRLISWTRLPDPLKPARLRVAESWASALDERVGSTQGLAARAACYTDFSFIERVFGAERIRRRLAERLQFVLELCPFLSPLESGSDAQLEAAHLVDYFCDDAVSIWRQAAMSHRRYLICPFTHPRIVRASLSFPRRDRYWRNGEIKPALKSLLRRRLPGYDTSLPKLASGLPVQRFVESGPLRHNPYFKPPDFFPSPRDLGRNSYPHWIAWSVLTLSIWRERVTSGTEAVPPISLSRSFH
jgi:asparagine synthase (glutamine-hydrolysing)